MVICGHPHLFGDRVAFLGDLRIWFANMPFQILLDPVEAKTVDVVGHILRSQMDGLD